MKGIVLISYLDYLEHAYGMEIANNIIKQSDTKSKGVYVALTTYDDKEIVNLIGTTSKLTDTTLGDVEFNFGTYFFDELLKEYGHHFQKSSFIEFINHLNNYIHPEVEASIEDANTPKFRLDVNEMGFKLLYTSNRGMHHFAHGILIKCNEFYRNQYKIEKGNTKGTSTEFIFEKWQ